MLGQFPIERITPGSVFGAGPLMIKYGHVRKPTVVEAYICVFVSLTVSLTVDLTSDAFIGCLKRISRRPRSFGVITAQTSLEMLENSKISTNSYKCNPVKKMSVTISGSSFPSTNLRHLQSNLIETNSKKLASIVDLSFHSN